MADTQLSENVSIPALGSLNGHGDSSSPSTSEASPLIIKKNGTTIAIGPSVLDLIATVEETDRKQAEVSIAIPARDGWFGDGSWGSYTLDGVQDTVENKFSKDTSPTQFSIANIERGSETVTGMGGGTLSVGEETSPLYGFEGSFTADNAGSFSSGDENGGVLYLYQGATLVAYASIRNVLSDVLVSLAGILPVDTFVIEADTDYSMDDSSKTVDKVLNAIRNDYAPGIANPAMALWQGYIQLFNVGNFNDYVLVTTDDVNGFGYDASVYIDAGVHEMTGVQDVVPVSTKSFLIYHPDTISELSGSATAKELCTYTLLADAFFEMLEITEAAKLLTGCFRLFAKTITVNGRIKYSSGSGFLPTGYNGASGGDGGAQVLPSPYDGLPGDDGLDRDDSIFTAIGTKEGGSGGNGQGSFVGLHAATYGGSGGATGGTNALSEHRRTLKAYAEGGIFVNGLSGTTAITAVAEYEEYQNPGEGTVLIGRVVDGYIQRATFTTFPGSFLAVDRDKYITLYTASEIITGKIYEVVSDSQVKIWDISNSGTFDEGLEYPIEDSEFTRQFNQLIVACDAPFATGSLVAAVDALLNVYSYYTVVNRGDGSFLLNESKSVQRPQFEFGMYLSAVSSLKVWYRGHGQAGGGGGGGAGADIIDFNYGGTGGVGGAGGANAGMVIVCAKNILGAGSIQCNGYQGEDGAAGETGHVISATPPAVYTKSGGGGGGGAGGSGGIIVLIYTEMDETVGTKSVGALGGLGGLQYDPVTGVPSSSGNVGQAGYDGQTIEVQIL